MPQAVREPPWDEPGRLPPVRERRNPIRPHAFCVGPPEILVMRTVHILSVCAALLSAGPAVAQSASGLNSGITTGAPSATSSPGTLPAGSVGSTATGDAPLKSGSTTAVGQTKPPGDAAPGTRSDLEEKSRELDRKIDKGICVGCK